MSRGWLIVIALCVSAPASAAMIDNCDDPDYLDRTAPGADRTLKWDFPITRDPERCLAIRVGQSVHWDGNFGMHPLQGDEGDLPNPINVHDEGVAVFSMPGVYGFKCNYHDEMRGAIKVLAAGPVVPSSGRTGRAALAAALLLVGLVSVAVGRRRAAAVPPRG